MNLHHRSTLYWENPETYNSHNSLSIQCMLDYWYPLQVLLDITGQYNHLTPLQSILVFLCLNRLDFRPSLVSGVPSPRRMAGGVSGKACLWPKFIIKILVALLVVRNVIRWQSLAVPHDDYGSWHSYMCRFATTSFNFGLPTYFVWHYCYRRVLYAVFHRRVFFFKKVEQSCLTVVCQMTCQRSHICWCASCWHHVFVLLVQFALIRLKI